MDLLIFKTVKNIPFFAVKLQKGGSIHYAGGQLTITQPSTQIIIDTKIKNIYNFCLYKPNTRMTGASWIADSPQYYYTYQISGTTGYSASPALGSNPNGAHPVIISITDGIITARGPSSTGYQNTGIYYWYASDDIIVS